MTYHSDPPTTWEDMHPEEFFCPDCQFDFDKCECYSEEPACTLCGEAKEDLDYFNGPRDGLLCRACAKVDEPKEAMVRIDDLPAQRIREITGMSGDEEFLSFDDCVSHYCERETGNPEFWSKLKSFMRDVKPR